MTWFDDGNDKQGEHDERPADPAPAEGGDDVPPPLPGSPEPGGR